MSWKQKACNALSIVGSIASITGVSALWLTQLKPAWNWLLVIPVVVIGSSLFVSFAAMTYLIAIAGYHKISSPPHTPYDMPLKIAYVGLAIASGVIFLTVLGVILASEVTLRSQQALVL